MGETAFVADIIGVGVRVPRPSEPRVRCMLLPIEPLRYSVSAEPTSVLIQPC